MHTSICMYIHIHTYMRVYSHTYIHTQIYPYIHTHTHTHAHTCSGWQHLSPHRSEHWHTWNDRKNLWARKRCLYACSKSGIFCIWRHQPLHLFAFEIGIQIHIYRFEFKFVGFRIRIRIRILSALCMRASWTLVRRMSRTPRLLTRRWMYTQMVASTQTNTHTHEWVNIHACVGAQDGNTCLHIASAEGRYDIVKELCCRGGRELIRMVNSVSVASM